MADTGLAELDTAIKDFQNTNKGQRLHDAWMAFNEARKAGIKAHTRLRAFLDDWPRA